MQTRLDKFTAFYLHNLGQYLEHFDNGRRDAAAHEAALKAWLDGV